MTKRPALAYFWLLMGISIGLVSLGVIFSQATLQIWLNALWQTCQNGWSNLMSNPPLAWQMVVPITLVIILARTVWSLSRQFRATRRLADLFFPLRSTPPTRVQALLPAHRLTANDIVFLDVKNVHAFCLGFWRPRIWLTAGLVHMLTDEELAAVLAHEVRHIRRRDPLRLLIGRALKFAFFFLPLIKSLAEASELQQEIEADRYAIAHMGSDLPLLCALQKLLKNGHTLVISETAAYTPFNLTEARLKQLVYPPAPPDWSRMFLSGAINIAILAALSSTLYVTSCMQSAAQPLEVGACIADSLQSTSSSLSIPHYDW